MAHDSINNQERLDTFNDRLSKLFDLPAQNIQELMTKASFFNHRSWVTDGIDGIKFFHFQGGPRVAGADCGLVYFILGATFSMHSHIGDEWSLILRGRLYDGDGHVYHPGDIIHHLSSIRQQPFGNECG